MVVKNFIIDLAVYPFNVMVSIGESDELLANKLKRGGVEQSEIHLSEYDKIGKAKYCLFETGQSLIRIKKKPVTPEDYGHLQHEIFHCASAVLWRIGMKLEIQTSDEAYAYLIQYLTQKIYEKI